VLDTLCFATSALSPITQKHKIKCTLIKPVQQTYLVAGANGQHVQQALQWVCGTGQESDGGGHKQEQVKGKVKEEKSHLCVCVCACVCVCVCARIQCLPLHARVKSNARVVTKHLGCGQLLNRIACPISSLHQPA